MPIIPTPTLPTDGSDADVGDYNPIIIAILSVLNGQVDGDNILAGSLPWSVMDNFTDSIPAAAMKDEGNLVKYRNEAQINFVASGIVWTPTSGLGASGTEGVVYTTQGTRVNVDAVSNRTFAASKDTYIDIAPNGTVHYDPVNNGAAANNPSSGYIRVAVVVTNATTVTAIHSLARRNPGNEIGRFTAGVKTRRLTVQNIPKKKHITVRAILLAVDGTLDAEMTFNNDTGLNYNYAEIDDGTVFYSANNQPSLAIERGATNSTTFVKSEFYNILSRWKTGNFVSVVNGAPPTKRDAWFTWKNITQDFGRIDIVNNTSAYFDVGSEIIVYGDD